MREHGSPQRSAVSGRVMKMKVKKSKTDKEVSEVSCDSNRSSGNVPWPGLSYVSTEGHQ